MLEKVKDQIPRHVIAIDPGCTIFKRAWVMIELVVAGTLGSQLEQRYRAFDKESLQTYRANAGVIDIQECEATHPEDKVFILGKAKTMIEEQQSDMHSFNAKMTEDLFASLEKTGEDIERMEQPRVLCIGNAGVGVSTILNSIAKNVLFEHGCLSVASSLFERSQNGTIYMKARGLANVETRRSMAEAVTRALKRDGCYKVFFVVTLESGRVRPADRETIQLVLAAAGSLQGQFTIIINKLSATAVERFNNQNVFEEMSSELFAGHLQCAADRLFLVQKCQLSSNRSFLNLPANLLGDAPIVYLRSSQVGHVDGDSPEEKANRLEQQKKDLQMEQAMLRRELEPEPTSEQKPPNDTKDDDERFKIKMRALLEGATEAGTLQRAVQSAIELAPRRTRF